MIPRAVGARFQEDLVSTSISRSICLLTLCVAVIASSFALDARIALAQSGSGELVPLVVGEGDSLSVRFVDPFCMNRLTEGEMLSAVVAEDKIISQRVVVREGAAVNVQVATLENNGRGGKPGNMKLVFVDVEAADGARIPFAAGTSTLERKGNGRNIIAKFLTLFLIKGTAPCVGSEERFYPKVGKTMPVMVPGSR